MRTQVDLAAAFALIEASVDKHSAHTQSEPDSAQIIDLDLAGTRSTPRRTTSPRRRLALVGSIAVAATAAALVVALAGLLSPGSQSSLSHGHGPAAIKADGRTLPFTIAPSTGLQVIGVTSSATGRTVELADRSTHLTAWIGEPDRDTRFSPGLEAVTIGNRRGYYNDGSGPVLMYAAGATASSSPADVGGVPTHTSGATTSSSPTSVWGGGPAVVWEYTPGAFAVVAGVDPESPPSEARLLQVARGLRIAKSGPLTLSFRLTHAPESGALTKIVTESRLTSSAQAPYTYAPNATLCEADYSVPATGNGIGVTVEHAVPEQGNRGASIGSGVDVTVDGHAARWDVHFHQLVVDLGNDVHVRIVEQNFTGRYTLGLRQLEQVADLVELAPDAADPATWIAAQQGLP